ncbi:TylF/MycF/NovP-related O-methyltransferase [uncultured Cytophaga sp.]|uniref:TylF/MycF/NovP-related O-methyltransferase n=1 Tax=uncultured Cytophaga sp. TaxID=160238 RepID=UPI002626A7DA|nr:TylF/MycF/NovP-related O-methyltransferase [uncultured Cytophaga sp.]
MILAVSTVQFISLALILILFLLGFKFLETNWSYKISKPYKWEAAVKEGIVSKELIKIERNYRDKVRFYNFWFQVDRLKRMNVKGAFAELGVYQGETAMMLHQMDEKRTLHLFDTFVGFNDADLKQEKKIDDRYTTTNFADTNIDSVKGLFSNVKNVHFYPGYFPDTTKTLTEKTFALVHIDADLYLPTIEALKFFYPKVSAGGVLIIHDYNHTWEGIKQALDEFLPTIPESLIEIIDWQGSVMIIKNSK